MSKKTELRADLNRIGYQLGGAHLTQEARRATFSTVAQAMREKGYGIETAAQIGGRHLKAFAQRKQFEEATRKRWLVGSASFSDRAMRTSSREPREDAVATCALPTPIAL